MCGHCGCGDKTGATIVNLQTGKEIAMGRHSHDHDHADGVSHSHGHDHGHDHPHDPSHAHDHAHADGTRHSHDDGAHDPAHHHAHNHVVFLIQELSASEWSGHARLRENPVGNLVQNPPADSDSFVHTTLQMRLFLVHVGSRDSGVLRARHWRQPNKRAGRTRCDLLCDAQARIAGSVAFQDHTEKLSQRSGRSGVCENSAPRRR